MHFFSASVSKSESKFSLGKVWFCSHQLMETHLAPPLLFIVSALLFVAGQVVDYNFFFSVLSFCKSLSAEAGNDTNEEELEPCAVRVGMKCTVGWKLSTG